MNNEKEIITEQDILEEAKKTLGVELTNIDVFISHKHAKVNSFSEYLGKFNGMNDILTKRCPHCKKWSSGIVADTHKKLVICNVPTYRKENSIVRNYQFGIIMCPCCKKDFVTVGFMDTRFEYANPELINKEELDKDKPTNWFNALCYDKNAKAYPDEELDKTLMGSFVKEFNENNKK